MIGSITFKFKHQSYTDTVDFEGEEISLFHLKCLVVQKRELEKGLDFDLQVTDSVSGKVYQGEECALQTNTSVLLKKIAPNNNGILARMKKQGQGAKSLIPQTTPKEQNITSPGADTKQAAQEEFGLPADSSSQCEEDKALQDINALAGATRHVGGNRVWSRGSRPVKATNSSVPNKLQNRSGSGRGSFTAGGAPIPRVGPPRPDYTCHRCDIPGHYREDCPMTDDPDYQKSVVRVKTHVPGIPNSFLVPIADDHEENLESSTKRRMVVVPAWGGGGKYEVEVQTKRFEGAKKVGGGHTSATGILDDLPSHLMCELCQKLLVDAVIIPCCSKSTCDQCIRAKLAELNFKCPICSTEDISPDKILQNSGIRAAVEDFLQRMAGTKAQEAMGRVSQSNETVQRANKPVPSPLHLVHENSIEKDSDEFFGPDVYAAEAIENTEILQKINEEEQQHKTEAYTDEDLPKEQHVSNKETAPAPSPQICAKTGANNTDEIFYSKVRHQEQDGHFLSFRERGMPAPLVSRPAAHALFGFSARGPIPHTNFASGATLQPPFGPAVRGGFSAYLPPPSRQNMMANLDIDERRALEKRKLLQAKVNQRSDNDHAQRQRLEKDQASTENGKNCASDEEKVAQIVSFVSEKGIGVQEQEVKAEESSPQDEGCVGFAVHADSKKNDGEITNACTKKPSFPSEAHLLCDQDTSIEEICKKQSEKNAESERGTQESFLEPNSAAFSFDNVSQEQNIHHITDNQSNASNSQPKSLPVKDSLKHQEIDEGPAFQHDIDISDHNQTVKFAEKIIESVRRSTEKRQLPQQDLPFNCTNTNKNPQLQGDEVTKGRSSWKKSPDWRVKDTENNQNQVDRTVFRMGDYFHTAERDFYGIPSRRGDFRNQPVTKRMKSRTPSPLWHSVPYNRFRSRSKSPIKSKTSRLGNEHLSFGRTRKPLSPKNTPEHRHHEEYFKREFSGRSPISRKLKRERTGVENGNSRSASYQAQEPHRFQNKSRHDSDEGSPQYKRKHHTRARNFEKNKTTADKELSSKQLKQDAEKNKANREEYYDPVELREFDQQHLTSLPHRSEIDVQYRYSSSVSSSPKKKTKKHKKGKKSKKHKKHSKKLSRYSEKERLNGSDDGSVLSEGWTTPQKRDSLERNRWTMTKKGGDASQGHYIFEADKHPKH